MDNRFKETISKYLSNKICEYLKNKNAKNNNFIKSVIDGDIEMITLLLLYNNFSPYERELIWNGKMGVVISLTNNLKIIKIYSNYGLLINLKDLKKLNKDLLITDMIYRQILTLVN